MMETAHRSEEGENRRGPERRCIVSRAVRPQAEMIRFVVAPDGRVVADLDGVLPGRGLWVAAERSALDAAPRLFAKAARRPVVVEADLAERVGRQLMSRLLALLGLARRAGELVCGYEKVRALIEEGQAGLLIEARDAAPDGRRKLGRKAQGVAVLDRLAGADLSRALGRENVVHAAVKRGRFATRLEAEAERLRRCQQCPDQPSESRKG